MTATAIRHEVEIDTALADRYEAQARASADIHRAVDSIHFSARDKKQYRGRTAIGWMMTEEQAIAACPDRSYGQDKSELVEKLAEGRARWAAIEAEIKALNAQYTGWSRFFLVTSSAGGHIHRSMQCSTCTYTTTYGWLPQLSGLTEKDAVEDQGPRLCSVCFPTAPVEWTIGEQKPAKNYCSASGQGVKNYWQRRWVACPDCGKTVAPTRNGFIPKHVAA